MKKEIYALLLTMHQFIILLMQNKYAAKNKLHILTIPPYWPSLNAAEIVINSIKWKIKEIRASRQ